MAEILITVVIIGKVPIDPKGPIIGSQNIQ